MKRIFHILICLIFTIIGFLGKKPLWSGILFFGVGTIILTWFFFREKQKLSKLEDASFLKINGTGTIEYYDWGFYVESEKRSYYWNDIVNIIAYKQDLITMDQVNITCNFADETKFMINESMTEWLPFIEKIDNQLVLKKNWLLEVCNPAFAENLTLIYRNIRS